MNLTFASISGYGEIRDAFFREGKKIMIERHGAWYKEDAKGIYKYFKLFDDDVWKGLEEKYRKYFEF